MVSTSRAPPSLPSLYLFGAWLLVVPVNTHRSNGSNIYTLQISWFNFIPFLLPVVVSLFSVFYFLLFFLLLRGFCCCFYSALHLVLFVRSFRSSRLGRSRQSTSVNTAAVFSIQKTTSFVPYHGNCIHVRPYSIIWELVLERSFELHGSLAFLYVHVVEISIRKMCGGQQIIVCNKNYLINSMSTAMSAHQSIVQHRWVGTSYTR